MRQALFVLCILLFLLGGCHSKQVRHLASDAALIKPGQTTMAEVRKYLGEPNGRRDVSAGVAEMGDYEERPGFLGNMPVLGPLAGTDGYEMIVITLQNDLVTECEFRTFNNNDRKWVEDFTWEEVK
jgi:hypothetical protein